MRAGDWSRRLSRQALSTQRVAARVQAILHRTYPEPKLTVELVASTVDLEKAEVWKDGERTPLTAKELQLFEKLYENAGRIVTTGILCETICGEFWQGYESTPLHPYPPPAGEDRGQSLQAGFPGDGQGAGLPDQSEGGEVVNPGAAVFPALHLLHCRHFDAVPRGESPAGPDRPDRRIRAGQITDCLSGRYPAM